MSRNYKISFVGAGNVAWHLSAAFENCNHSIQEVYSRNSKNADLITSRLYEGSVKNDLDFSSSSSDVVIIAVNDDSIAEVVKKLKVPSHVIVIHTSGSVPLNVLKGFGRTGIFYPLQTFSKHREIEINEVPICLEASDDDTFAIMEDLAMSISSRVIVMDSEQRRTLHLAAVFASNFANHMLGICKEILDQENIPFSIMDTLISETVSKALDGDPKTAQTGPARRKDGEVLSNHLKQLQDKPLWKNVYKSVSESIMESSI